MVWFTIEICLLMIFVLMVIVEITKDYITEKKELKEKRINYEFFYQTKIK